MTLTISQAKQYGFVFEGARDWNTPKNRARIVQDAALATQPNSAVPVESAADIDPFVFEFLTAARNARRLFREEKKGDWTTPYAKFRISEMVGGTEENSD